MPTYVYKFIDTDETIEVHQSFTDDTLTEHLHPATGESMPVKKVFLPVGVTFKGDGFYKTDSRSSAKKSAKSDSGDSTSKSKSSSDSSDSSGGSSSSEKSKKDSSSSSSSSSTSTDAKTSAGSKSASSGD